MEKFYVVQCDILMKNCDTGVVYYSAEELEAFWSILNNANLSSVKYMKVVCEESITLQYEYHS